MLVSGLNNCMILILILWLIVYAAAAGVNIVTQPLNSLGEYMNGARCSKHITHSEQRMWIEK